MVHKIMFRATKVIKPVVKNVQQCIQKSNIGAGAIYRKTQSWSSLLGTNQGSITTGKYLILILKTV